MLRCSSWWFRWLRCWFFGLRGLLWGCRGGIGRYGHRCLICKCVVVGADVACCACLIDAAMSVVCHSGPGFLPLALYMCFGVCESVVRVCGRFRRYRKYVLHSAAAISNVLVVFRMLVLFVRLVRSFRRCRRCLVCSANTFADALDGFCAAWAVSCACAVVVSMSAISFMLRR